MQREIKFRGKVEGLDAPGFVFGSLIVLSDKTLITVPNGNGNSLGEHTYKSYRVDPATVGQYSTLSDKHGKNLWTDDIVKIDGRKMNYRIGFIDGMYVFWASGGSVYQVSKYCHMAEIIGNIHDNPELLEKPNV